MDNFDDLQKSWLAQAPEHLPATSLKAVQTKWQQHQRKVLFSNLGMSAAFLAAFIVIGWVYVAFRHQYRWPFTVSIACTYALLLVFLGVVWRNYGFKKEDLGEPSTGFIRYQLKKLNWQRKTLTTYIWIYNVLLWLALSMYTIEVTRRGTWLFTLMALGGITAYIAGITAWSHFYRQKKQLRAIDEMKTELETLRIELAVAE